MFARTQVRKVCKRNGDRTLRIIVTDRDVHTVYEVYHRPSMRSMRGQGFFRSSTDNPHYSNQVHTGKNRHFQAYLPAMSRTATESVITSSAVLSFRLVLFFFNGLAGPSKSACGGSRTFEYFAPSKFVGLHATLRRLGCGDRYLHENLLRTHTETKTRHSEHRCCEKLNKGKLKG
jgi:hypothetical protein